MHDELEHAETERLLRMLAEVQPPAAMNDRLLRRLRDAQAQQASAPRASRWLIPATAAFGIIFFLGSMYQQERGTRIDREKSEVATRSKARALNLGAAHQSAPQVESLGTPRSVRTSRMRSKDSVRSSLRLPSTRLSKALSPALESQHPETSIPANLDGFQDAAPASSPGSALPGLTEVSFTGHSLPGFDSAADLGAPLPSIPAARVLGYNLPGFQISAPPGNPLPTFAEATKDGDSL